MTSLGFMVGGYAKSIYPGHSRPYAVVLAIQNRDLSDERIRIRWLDDGSDGLWRSSQFIPVTLEEVILGELGE